MFSNLCFCGNSVDMGLEIKAIMHASKSKKCPNFVGN
jgi:hypothetical protein